MILELKDIKLSFTGKNDEALNLLKGVSFGIKAGMITALIGGNGSGKTTLFNIISGFQDGYKGEVFFKGKRISGLAPHKVAKLGIGRLFQSKQLVPELSIMDNMKLGSDNTAGEFPLYQLFLPYKVAQAEKEKEERAIRILKELFGAENKYLQQLDQPSGSLSFGEQRLIALARLLMSDASLLLLDEPSSGVNPESFKGIAQAIKKIVELSGATILLVEHNINFILDLADEALYLDSGIVQFHAPTQEVLNNPLLKDRYIGL